MHPHACTRRILLMLTACRRLASLDRARRRLLIEAAASIALVWAGLRVVPFLNLLRLLDRWVALPLARKREPANPNAVASVTWAVTTASARFPPATCLIQALAAAAMLRRRGLTCQLRIGVRTRGCAGGAPLDAHAWVECEGRIAIGDLDHLSDLAVMAPLGSP